MATLLCSLGNNWEIPFESISFLAYNDNFDIFKDSPYIDKINSQRQKYISEKLDKVIIFTTEQKDVLKYINELFNNLDLYLLKYNEGIKDYEVYILKGIEDIDSTEASIAFENMIYSVMLKERYENQNGKIYISIAGGRKTISSSLHSSAFIFGGDCIFHIIENGNLDRNANILEKINHIIPIVIGKYPKSDLYNEKQFNSFYLEITENFKNYDKDIIYNKGYKIKKIIFTLDINIHDIIVSEIENATNYYINWINTSEDNFRILYKYRKEVINILKQTYVGHNKNKIEDDLSLLKKLPKVDLHCHLGGCLNCEDIISLSNELKDDIKDKLKNLTNIPSTLDEFIDLIKKNNGIKNIYRFHPLRSYIILKFVSLFNENIEKFEKYIFNNFIDSSVYRNIGIQNYEKLGDIQGSSILQSEKPIKFVVRKIIEKSKKENVKHLEIRCSPINYTREGLNENDVIRAILEEINRNSSDISISLIIIASRHGKMSDVYRHIELVMDIMEGQDDNLKNLFYKYFKGFDLAGDESLGEPEEFRQAFLKVTNYFPNITIHAGETKNFESIIKAIYHLNAERIGHGLSLIENENLLKKVIERKIALELCPSSNFQINNYYDYFIDEKIDLNSSVKNYPLKYFLQKGVKVTINTDNLGISRTNITNEFLKAARMTEGGLSLWDILKIIKYGVKSSFVDFEKRKELYQKVEKDLELFIEKL